MTTAQDLVWATKAHLLGNTREEQNVLASSYTAGGTTLTFVYPLASIASGANVEVDQEIFRVVSVSGLVATVIGGQYGTTNVNHASGVPTTTNPRFPVSGILRDLNNTLSDLDANGLYREVSLNITFNPVISAYDLTGSDTVLDVLEVRYRITGPTKRNPVIRSWSLMRDMDTAIFPSGNALVIDSGGFPGLPLRVRYAAPFVQIASLSDDISTTVGLSYTAQDLPPMGAAIRQMLGRDIKRTFLEAQPDTRRAQEVPPGVAQGALTSLRREYQDGIEEERMRQLQRFPYRMAR
jgi:hypothetical protein